MGTPSLRCQEPSPEEDVRRTLVGFFDALREKDEDRLRGAVAAGAQITGIRTMEGRPVLQVTNLDEFIPRALTSPARMDERNWDTEVVVRGDLANVWQRFNMFIDGSLSHCGTELIHLFRFPDGWRILHISETLTTVGCRTP